VIPYIKELDWCYDFSLTLVDLLAIANKRPQWHSSMSPAGQFSMLGRSILDIDVFNKINNKLQTNSITIKNGILRKTTPYTRGFIHTDSVNQSLSLNIPLLNPTSAVTSWYDFSSNDMLASASSTFSTILPNSPFYEFKKGEMLPYKVFDFKMSKPVIFNNSIHHNVESVENVDRIILSILFVKFNGQAVKWEDCAVFEELQLT
jgi:hypothetical protein